jgi:hypothetical protein
MTGERPTLNLFGCVPGQQLRMHVGKELAVAVIPNFVWSFAALDLFETQQFLFTK